MELEFYDSLSFKYYDGFSASPNFIKVQLVRAFKVLLACSIAYATVVALILVPSVQT